MLSALKTAALHYDVKREKKRDYNRYALAQYLQRLDQCAECVKSGATWRAALIAGFNDRLLDFLIVKGLKEEKPTKEEIQESLSFDTFERRLAAQK